MKVTLFKRMYGVHTPLKTAEVDGGLEVYYKGLDNINEELLLEKIPEGFLPVDHSEILLKVAKKNKEGRVTGSTGQRGLSHFRDWEKYFHAYSIELE